MKNQKTLLFFLACSFVPLTAKNNGSSSTESNYYTASIISGVVTVGIIMAVPHVYKYWQSRKQQQSPLLEAVIAEQADDSKVQPTLADVIENGDDLQKQPENSTDGDFSQLFTPPASEPTPVSPAPVNETIENIETRIANADQLKQEQLAKVLDTADKTLHDMFRVFSDSEATNN
jgi:hypothetical protein